MGEYKEGYHRDLKQDQEEEEEEEEEETLSLCDLPLEDDDNNEKEASAMTNQSQRSSSEPPEFFEFFSNFTSEMCSAEDIIFCGKLVPFKDPTQNHKSHHHHHDKRHLSFRRRSESLSGLNSSVSRSNSINNNRLMMRNSRSLDYRKLERFSSSKKSPESENSIERNSSVRSIGRGSDNGMIKRATKPRWYVLMFGVVKPPIEMELRDIKSRQFRRNSLAAADSVKKPPVGKGSCRLLKVLSCRDNTSVAVTTSFCMPPARFK